MLMRGRTMRRFVMAIALATGVLAAGLIVSPAAAAPQDGFDPRATMARLAPASDGSLRLGTERQGRAVSAVGSGLWHCSPFGDNFTYACTTITSAPAGGVQVLDRVSNRIYTLYNGNSIALWAWYKDTSGRCGVGGNSYVWWILWQNQGYHYAYIGDHYLNTGPVSNWNDFTDTWGNLGNDLHYFGTGSGTCDVFPG
jgi:hypothetical protein